MKTLACSSENLPVTQFTRLQQSFNALVPKAISGSLNYLLAIDSQSQLLDFYRCGLLAARYPVSTAINGIGCNNGSGCTPHGWHLVEEKIGDGYPLGTVFKGRVAGGVARTLRDTSSVDLITSRIMWLTGLEPGVNLSGSVDSHARYIYVHGTAQEHLIGQAVSQGCIRLRNRDVIELFSQIPERTPVYISKAD